MPSNKELRQAANTLRRVVELTVGLPADSQDDAVLRDRLEFAADLLDTAANTRRAV